MGLDRLWRVSCDRCPTRGPWGENSTKAVDMAKAEGWTYGFHPGDLCPQCQQEREQHRQEHPARVQRATT